MSKTKRRPGTGTAQELGITNSGRAGVDHTPLYFALSAKAKGINSLLIQPLRKAIMRELRSDWKDRTLSRDVYQEKTQFGIEPKGLKGWRPGKAFTPKMLKTGPTRQVENAIKLLGIGNSKKKKK